MYYNTSCASTARDKVHPVFTAESDQPLIDNIPTAEKVLSDISKGGLQCSS